MSNAGINHTRAVADKRKTLAAYQYPRSTRPHLNQNHLTAKKGPIDKCLSVLNMSGLSLEYRGTPDQNC